MDPGLARAGILPPALPAPTPPTPPEPIGNAANTPLYVVRRLLSTNANANQATYHQETTAGVPADIELWRARLPGPERHRVWLAFRRDGQYVAEGTDRDRVLSDIGWMRDRGLLPGEAPTPPTTPPEPEPQQDWAEIGRQAFRNGETRAPAVNPAVQEAIANLPVGQGAGEIMREFTRGWDEANLAAPVPEPEPEPVRPERLTEPEPPPPPPPPPPDFAELGRQAFASGEPNTPSTNPAVLGALRAVGGGRAVGADVALREFSRGWDEANEAEQEATRRVEEPGLEGIPDDVVGIHVDNWPEGRPLPSAEWAVWNAPRPLYGGENWTGAFRAGTFYAAHRRDDTYFRGSRNRTGAWTLSRWSSSTTRKSATR